MQYDQFPSITLIPQSLAPLSPKSNVYCRKLPIRRADFDRHADRVSQILTECQERKCRQIEGERVDACISSVGKERGNY